MAKQASIQTVHKPSLLMSGTDLVRHQLLPVGPDAAALGYQIVAAAAADLLPTSELVHKRARVATSLTEPVHQQRDHMTAGRLSITTEQG